jgi:hypothetical protein
VVVGHGAVEGDVELVTVAAVVADGAFEGAAS